MPRVITRGKETPPLTLGPLRLHYQYSVGVPQMHLGFVSVLQGLVFGVLLLGLPLPTTSDVTDLASFVQFVLDQHGYLAYFVSSSLILVIWAQYAQISLYAVWPLSSGQLGLSLLLSVAELLAVRAIGQFGLWLIGLGAVGVVGGVIRLNNLRLSAPEDFESAKLATQIRRGWFGALYVCLGLLTIAGGISFLSLPHWGPHLSATEWAQVSSGIEWIVLGVLSALAMIIAAADHRQRRRLLETALADSDLMVMGHGVIRYRPQQAATPAARREVSEAVPASTHVTTEE